MNTNVSSSRGKPAGRRKAIANDDAPYTSSAVGVKRQAMERLEGEPRTKRTKRAMLDATQASQNMVDERPMVDFREMPTLALYNYMAHYDLIPHVYPHATSASDPIPTPNLLSRPALFELRAMSPPQLAQSITPANRPKRDPKQHQQLGHRRRGSRLPDDDQLVRLTRTPILADADELHLVMARICQKHFTEDLASPVGREVEALAKFMCAVEKWKSGRER
ncbi:hypothetical protein DL96DRAFT_6874 [Flagelloscypha sp. PMI_526]|nr:hypothetical protein DL96DRAFT_6874 [Flagelloscypha sp. PMI_526]